MSNHSVRFTHQTTVNVAAPRMLVRIEALIKKHSLALVLGTALGCFLVPAIGLTIRATRLGTVPVTGWKYDALTLALSFIMLSASVQLQPSDLATVARSRAKGTLAGTVYLVGAVLGLLAANAARFVLHDDVAQPLSLGLLLIGLMPVAMTSAAWVRMNAGNVPLLLGAIVVTNIIAVPVVPWILQHLASTHDVGASMQMGPVIQQLTLAILFPVFVGMTARAVAPGFIRRIQPLLGILSTIGLLVSLGSTVSSSRPQIEAHTSEIVQAAIFTLGLNAAFYFAGVRILRIAPLERADAITLLFGSSMRNMGAAMVVAAVAFPEAPLVAIPAAVFSISQQIFSGMATNAFEKNPQWVDASLVVENPKPVRESAASIPSIHPPPA